MECNEEEPDWTDNFWVLLWKRAKKRNKMEWNKLLFYMGCFNLLKMRDVSAGLCDGLYGWRWRYIHKFGREFIFSFWRKGINKAQSSIKLWKERTKCITDFEDSSLCKCEIVGQCAGPTWAHQLRLSEVPTAGLQLSRAAKLSLWKKDNTTGST